MRERSKERRQRWTVDQMKVDTEPRKEGATPRTIRSLAPVDLDIVYQPIVSLDSGDLYAQEALVRGRHDGLRRPDQLLALAHAEGAMGRLGRIIREATFARTQSKRLFVNIHPEELSSRWLIRPDDPMCMFEGEVFLEITESAAFDYYDLCRSVLLEVCARIRARLVVDDFGAGYSNLKRVLDLEPAVVKLDRALITGIDRNRRQFVLVQQLVATCDALDAKVVAEGIETEDELKAVCDAGVHYGQGYFLARPSFPEPTSSWRAPSPSKRPNGKYSSKNKP